MEAMAALLATACFVYRVLCVRFAPLGVNGAWCGRGGKMRQWIVARHDRLCVLLSFSSLGLALLAIFYHLKKYIITGQTIHWWRGHHLWGSMAHSQAVLVIFGLSVFVLSSIMALAAIVLAIVGMSRSGFSGKKMAIAGIVVACLGLAAATAGSGIVWKISIIASKDIEYSKCEQRAEEISLLLRYFAEEKTQDLLYPELQAEAGKLTCADWGTGYKEKISACSSTAPDVCAYLADRFFYLGYVVRDQASLELFADLYKKRLLAKKTFEADLTNDGVTLHRLRIGVEGLLTEAQNKPAARLRVAETIPVAIERLGHHHRPEGGHVVYLDGHIEFIKYPGKWPITPEAFETLNSIRSSTLPR